MQTLTRHVQEDENRQRQQKADAVADKVREGDVSRQGEEISCFLGKQSFPLFCVTLRLVGFATVAAIAFPKQARQT